MNPEYEKTTKAYQTCIEQYLDETCFCHPEEPQQVLFEAMRYSLLAGGKRLRPVFVFHFCRMCGGDWEKAVPFAAAIEMVHTYSLIHDDLPCMDNDDYRRGRLTNHKVYGEANAVLAGDALLTAAFSQLAKAPYSAEIRIRAVDVLSQCAGELGMVGGQVLDMRSEETECTEKEVRDIQSRKTGALIKAACVLGVLAADGTESQIQAATSYADHIGLAFQVRDDILDVIGNAKELGKAVGVDTAKNTFTHIYGLDKCEEIVIKETELALESLKSFDHHEYMFALSNWMTARNY